MLLYHFTSLYHLRGISQYGLTVGDIPTDIDRFKGRIGVWLTSSPRPDGHGLGGGLSNKKGFRLLVDVPEEGALKKWSEWAPGKVTERTLKALRTADGFKENDFYVYFGWLVPERILDVVDVASGMSVPKWGTLIPETVCLPGVPFGERRRWQKRMLKTVREACGEGGKQERDHLARSRRRVASVPPDIPSSLNPPQINKAIESRQPDVGNAQSLRQYWL